jgi:ABC-2 type transport system permease protein
LLMTALFYAIVSAVIAGVWRAAANANGGVIAGYSAVAITWYLVASEAGTISMNFRLMEDIGADIATGAVAIELLRPTSVVGHRVVNEIGRVVPKLAVCLAVALPLGWFAGGEPPSASGLLWAVPSLVLAVACNIVAQHACAAASFWLRESRTTWFLYQKGVFMLGGMLIPLEVLPAWLRTIGDATPFPSMAYAPARLASGHVELQLIAVQIGWLAVLSVIAVVVFGLGERRLQVVGG